jgi:hypothetical protein
MDRGARDQRHADRARERAARDLAEAVGKVLAEVGGIDVPQGPHFADLVDVIEEQLIVELATVLGAEGRDPEAVRNAAESIALEVDFGFTLTPRAHPEADPEAVRGEPT